MKRVSYIKRGLTGFFISAALILLDQFAKILAVSHLKGKENIELIPGFLELQYLENRGAAFGILQDKRWLLIIFTCIVLAAIAYVYLRKIPDEKRYRLFRLTVILLFSGAFGNFIDRLTRNYVVDFFNFLFIEFPVFNVADIYITAAALLLIIVGLFYYKEEDYEKIFSSSKKETRA